VLSSTSPPCNLSHVSLPFIPFMALHEESPLRTALPHVIALSRL
jgi:hypothetical protein